MKEINKRYVDNADLSGLLYGIIEVTTKCQCACLGCYMVKRRALNHGEMTLAQAIKVLNFCHDYCGQELETMDILGGEPLLWLPLQKYITTLLKRGIKPWVFTNMLAITPALAKWLFERRINITGKLNINPDDTSQLPLQAKMLGKNINTAKKMIAAIDVFLGTGYQAPLFHLQNLIRKANIDFIPGYYRWCLQRNIGTDLELMGSGEPIGPAYWEVAPTPQQIADLVLKIQKVRGEFGLKPAEVLMPHLFGTCPFYDKGLYFAVDGHIRACSNSTIILSHIDDDDPIRKAYESSLICNRLRLSQGEVNIGEPCNSCKQWKGKKCRGGCRATAEGMGDPFGGYTLCPVPLLKAKNTGNIGEH